MKKVKEIKGDSFDLRTRYFDYEYNGEYKWVQGELFYNKAKKRFEHQVFDDNDELEAIIYWEWE